MRCPCRTRMRPPVVKGHTSPMSGGFLLPAYRAWRRRPSGSGADWIAGHRCHPSVAAPPTSCGAVATVGARAEHRWGESLRPRHAAVLADRPRHRGGCGAPGRARRGGGAAHVPWGDYRLLEGASAGVQAQGRAPGDKASASLGVPRRRSPGLPARARAAAPWACPVRRQAPPRGAPRDGGPGPSPRPWGACTAQRRPAPAGGPGW